ncbi:MAG: IS30 family transposase [Pseudomonas sp.]|uniref:IS30 family transposase n=1 Tax=Stutzerimonas stutzeri TaxID=316 RepID=UPI00185E14F6|nr:IS30 family transposase [Stutzerimonas stutzeri]MBA4725314.1 IS30 family transposase [Pseudomonas sp.]
MSYHELSIEERSNIQIGLVRSMSQRAITRMLNRSPSTICREIRRNRDAQGAYTTQHAQRAMCKRRWEGDLIKGKANASAVGTLVERTSGYLMLVKMSDATATSAVEGFSAALNRMPLAARKSMTYDQGREMARHAEITQKTGVAIYFCDPHSPWQRGSNENINGLIRQYLPKGADLSVYSQEQLDAIAYELNIRPRKRFGFKCPIEVMTELMAKHHEAPASLQ